MKGAQRRQAIQFMGVHEAPSRGRAAQPPTPIDDTKSLARPA